MKVSEVADKSSGLVSICGELPFPERELSSVEYDSRKAAEGSLFVAVRGFESDGHDYIKAAAQGGCSAVVVSSERAADFSFLADQGIALFSCDDSRKALSRLSSLFFKEPSMSMHIDGITGTNGKTSITYLIESIYKKAGISCGVIGTVNYRWKGREIPAPNTTPESRDIQELLRKMADDGVTHVVMEVSSHALELGRVDDVEFDTASFTNLTGDHLDFHKSLDAYFDAKKKLFTLLDRSRKKGKTAIINIDDAGGKVLVSEGMSSNFDIITYGEELGADIRGIEETVDNRITGLGYTLCDHGMDKNVSLSLAGRFQLYNSLAAYSIASSAGVDGNDAVAGMEELVNVPGRLEVVDSGLGFAAVVDYAHTSDALLKLLQSVAGMEHNRIITVFGCGGDRDRTKRPVMGEIGVDNSDFAIVTSDNPRTEDMQAVINDIIKGIRGNSYSVEPDREKAIAIAVDMAVKGDIIVIAGKGHEDYQIIGKTKHHFDDREVVLKYMTMRNSN